MLPHAGGHGSQEPAVSCLEGGTGSGAGEAGTETKTVQVPDNLKLKPGESNADLAKVIAAIQHRGSDALKTQHSSVFASYQNTPDYAPELVEVVRASRRKLV